MCASGNDIMYIPEAIGVLKALRILDLAANKYGCACVCMAVLVFLCAYPCSFEFVRVRSSWGEEEHRRLEGGMKKGGGGNTVEE